MKYIDIDRIQSEIEKHQNDVDEISQKHGGKNSFRMGRQMEIDLFQKFINSLQREYPKEQPEYGYLSTEYVNGKKSRWNVGDILAYYLCTSNEEGEIVIGKIVNVEFDDEEGWIYTFEDEGASDEQSLIEQGVYKIVENGK